jgi:hypothetical protein
MHAEDVGEVRASARLPHVEIDIVHRRTPEGDAELLSITLQAVPSFRAVEDLFAATNPFLFWARLAETAWQPWFEACRQMLAPPRSSGANSPRLPDRTRND